MPQKLPGQEITASPDPADEGKASGGRIIRGGRKMTNIKSSNDYKEFMKAFLTRDDVGQVSPPDSFDVMVNNQGRWKSYRFVYESETKWCSTTQQVKDILKKNRHSPDRQYSEARKFIASARDESPKAE
jgi:hypothetical protein